MSLEVIWKDDAGLERLCKVIRDNGLTYNLLLPERNVPIERLYYDQSNEGERLKKGSNIWYYKEGKYQKCLLEKIDWSSNSAQIRPIVNNVYKYNCGNNSNN